MKILFTTSFYPPYHLGGDAMHVKYLAEALAGMGHEVHVLHSMDAYEFKRGKRGAAEKENFPRIKNLTVHSLRSPLGRLEPVLNYCVGTQKHTMDSFMKLVRKERFDVVHHHNISLLGYNLLKKQGDYKNIYTAHDYWLVCHKYDLMKGPEMCTDKDCLSCCLRYKKPYQYFRKTQRFKEALRYIDEIIAPSKFMGDILREDFQSVKVIHNFIRNPLSSKKVLIGDYFIFAGALIENKGILDLVEVFSRTDKKLVVVGRGEAEPELRSIIREKRIKNVELLGWKNQAELFPLIKSAQALIVPSKWPENNPLIALESLSLGTPVIGSEMGGIPEILGKLDKRLIFRDFKQLEGIIKRFKRGDYKSEEVSGVYNRYFSQDIFLNKYLNLLRRAGK